MDIYEESYTALRILLPGLSDWQLSQPKILRARSADLPEVHATLCERHAYTSDIWLSYQLSTNHKLPIYVPDFTIRIYHDAQQAEVLQGSLKDHWKIQIGPNTEARSRFLVNQTLHRWLQHLSQAEYACCESLDS